MRNFTPPAWLPEQTYGCSKWYIATFRDGSDGYARYESIGGRDVLMVHGHFGSRFTVANDKIATLEPEYITDIDWATFDAAFDKGGVTFAKEQGI